MIDCPKYGYENWRSYFSRILSRLKVKVDKQTLGAIVTLLEDKQYQLLFSSLKMQFNKSKIISIL